MIINTKAGALRPVNIELENNLIEVVPEFKLLGCTIHDKLRFDKHLKNLKSAVCSKLFTIKNLNNSPKQNCLNFFRHKLEINNKTQTFVKKLLLVSTMKELKS